MEDQLDQLRLTLQELEQELQQIDHLDDASRERLQEVMESIHDALHRQDTDALQDPSLRERVDQRKEYLEDTSYPSLTRLLNNLADILGNSGL